MELPSRIQNAIDSFSRIPGVGSKTAMRQILQMCSWDDRDIQEFGNTISELTSLVRCRLCGFYSEEELCSVCSNTKRMSNGVICIVESISDCLAIEKSETFNGAYHILGGVMNPLMGIGPDELGIDKLVKRIAENFNSVILAINPSVEGDATCSYIKDHIPDEINVDRIGFGIPMGGSLEYVDALTISKALENRKKM
ncbi:MAG: recombination protein RecR [Bacteriovoracaceae bacterium]|nr:recombination protein RecR [Bacteriovoracaceae bacterium]